MRAIRAGTLLLAMLATVVGCIAPGPGRAVAGPVAVVLLAGPDRLVALDLTAGVVRSAMPLRSAALDLAVDDETGVAVTAQCGGVGTQADDAIGLWPVRRGGPVRYVKLPRPNPGFVVADHGRAWVSHGWFESGGLFAEAVDLRAAKVTRVGRLPDGPGQLSLAAGRLWTVETARPESGTGEATGGAMCCVNPESFESSRAFAPADGAVAVVDASGALLAVGGRDGAAWIAQVDPVGGRVLRRVALPGFATGVSAARAVGGALAIADGSELDPAADQGSITIVDTRTLRSLRRISVAGGVGAMADWGERLVAVRCDGTSVSVIDPSTGRLEHRMELGQGPSYAVRVEVLD
jgi:hypothetical protein